MLAGLELGYMNREVWSSDSKCSRLSCRNWRLARQGDLFISMDHTSRLTLKLVMAALLNNTEFEVSFPSLELDINHT
jgi:hypothetical protein